MLEAVIEVGASFFATNTILRQAQDGVSGVLIE
jgi:hypothetical protein